MRIGAGSSGTSPLLCLQEVWTAEAQEAVLSALALPPENVYYVSTEGEGETGKDVCEPNDIEAIVACVRKHCAGEPDEELAICAVDNCIAEGAGLYFRDRDCLNCLTAMAGVSLEQSIRTCTEKGGASRLYGGRNGIILASRWPLLDKEAIRLPSSAANRVALFARVEVPGRGPVEVACTHLSAKNYLSPTHPAFGDWSEEQHAQLRQISEKLLFRAQARPQLFMGDMNCGQRHDPVNEPLMWGSWKLAADLGFVSPAEYAEPPFCSWCSGNHLTDSDGDRLIDHVFVRNPDEGAALRPLTAYRILDEMIVFLDRRGKKIIAHLSDHYGVVVEFDLR